MGGVKVGLTDRANRRSGRRAACLEFLPTASRVTDASCQVERVVRRHNLISRC